MCVCVCVDNEYNSDTRRLDTQQVSEDVAVGWIINVYETTFVSEIINCPGVSLSV